MVRGDERGSAAMEVSIPQTEIVVEIDMVEVHQRQEAGKCAGLAQMQFRVNAFEV